MSVTKTGSEWQSVEPAGIEAELQLREHFARKRDSERHALEVDVVVRGRAGSFPARSFDLSRSGILLQITDHRYTRDGEDLASYAFKVQQHFRTGADIQFVDQDFATRATVIRVTQTEEPVSGILLFACSFKQLLSPGQCAALGIEA